MEQFETAFEKLPGEIAKSLEAMSKTNDPQLRKLHSEIISNLSNSFASFVNTMDKMNNAEFDDYDDDDADEEFINDFLPAYEEKLQKKKGKKGKKDDMPF